MPRQRSHDFNPVTLRDFPSTGRYLIGVSGGSDSVALLHWLMERDYRKLIVCHLDHGLRGRASRADARFVEKLAERYQLVCEIGKTDVREFAAREKLSLETAARAVRYAFFAKVAGRRRCHTIFLAHHSDDLVETFLINLFRGAGLTGLCAIRDISDHRSGKIELKVVRPWLSVWREQIDAYVRRNRLRFREDASNRSLGPLRNRVRHRVIPYLEKQFGRKIRMSLWRAAMIAAEEENFFEALLPRQLSKLSELEVETLRELPLGLQRRTLRAWLHGRDVPNVSFDLIERIRALLDLTSRVAKTNLPGNRHARRRAKKIFIE